jgi:hypothetical protein
MLTTAEIEHMFTYHPPSTEQQAKYAAISAAVAHGSALINSLQWCTKPVKTEAFARINDITKAIATTMCEHCPPSADLSAAIRCVRLVRNACNAYARTPEAAFLITATQELIKAKWQANSAIALHRPWMTIDDAE